MSDAPERIAYREGEPWGRPSKVRSLGPEHGPLREGEAEYVLASTADRVTEQRDAYREALVEIVSRFERCIVHSGSDEEYAREATAKARAALAATAGEKESE